MVTEPQDPSLARRAAFLSVLPALLDAHEGKYALMHDGRVVGIYDTMGTAYSEGLHRFGLQPIYIGHITRKPDVVQIPALIAGVLRVRI